MLLFSSLPFSSTLDSWQHFCDESSQIRSSEPLTLRSPPHFSLGTHLKIGVSFVLIYHQIQSRRKSLLTSYLNYYHCFMAELAVFSLELDWKKCGNFKNEDKSWIPDFSQMNQWQNLYILPETFIFKGRTELLFLIIIICFAVWSLICCFQNRFMTTSFFRIQTDMVILSSYI